MSALNTNRKNWRIFCALAVTGPLMLPTAGHAGGGATGNNLPRFFNQQERSQFPSLGDITRVRFLTTVDFPPFNSLDPAGRLTGFNIDLAGLICSQLSIANLCQIEAVPWNELEQRLEQGDGEAIIAGLTPQAATRQKFLFTRVYLRLPARFLTTRRNPLPSTSAAAVAGKKIGVVENSLHARLLQTYFPDSRPIPFKDAQTMLAALRADEIDAIFADSLTLIKWQHQPENTDCCMLAEGAFMTPQSEAGSLAIAVSAKHAPLRAAFDNALQALERSGAIEELYLRYFPTSLY